MSIKQKLELYTVVDEALRATVTEHYGDSEVLNPSWAFEPLALGVADALVMSSVTIDSEVDDTLRKAVDHLGTALMRIAEMFDENDDVSMNLNYLLANDDDFKAMWAFQAVVSDSYPIK
jgi:hypothetical protein